MDDTIKIIKSLEESGSLIKFVSKTIESRTKTSKGWICWHVNWYIRC